MSHNPRLLDQVRAAIRVRHYSYRTEQQYVAWIRRYILFHGRRHPSLMGGPEVEAFLSHLAVERHVSAARQTQALAAILFLYKRVLNVDLPWLAGVIRANVFPADRPSRDPRSSVWRRHHIFGDSVQRNVKEAVRASKIDRPATSHTFRHSFATHVIESGADIRTVQELMGHSSVKTTQMNPHVRNRGIAARNPLDSLQ